MIPSPRVMRGAEQNWAVALEIVALHPGISLPALAVSLAADPRCAWANPKQRLSEARANGAMGRAGIRSEKVGRVVRMWTQ